MRIALKTAALVLIPAVAAVLQAPAITVVHVPDGLVADGDIVFRRGASLVSRMVLAADGEGYYSHAGIVQIRDGQPWVIHASVDEPADPADGVIAEPLTDFLAPDRAAATAVFRPRIPDEALRTNAAEIAARFARSRLPFDLDFDLDTPGALYCTELVWRAYRDAGLDLVDGRFRHLSIPFRTGDYLLPSDLARSAALEPVFTTEPWKEKPLDEQSPGICGARHRCPDELLDAQLRPGLGRRAIHPPRRGRRDQ